MAAYRGVIHYSSVIKTVASDLENIAYMKRFS